MRLSWFPIEYRSRLFARIFCCREQQLQFLSDFNGSGIRLYFYNGNVATPHMTNSIQTNSRSLWTRACVSVCVCVCMWMRVCVTCTNDGATDFLGHREKPVEFFGRYNWFTIVERTQMNLSCVSLRNIKSYATLFSSHKSFKLHIRIMSIILSTLRWPRYFACHHVESIPIFIYYVHTSLQYS